MTANQMKYLLTFTHQPHNLQNQTNIAKIFGVNKSTVHRAISEAQKQGILADMGDGLQLTGYGNNLLSEYEKKQKSIISWLIIQGISEEKAIEDSFKLLEVCSESTLNLITTNGQIASSLNKLNQSISSQKEKASNLILGEKLEAFLEEGEYPLSFIFYRILDPLSIDTREPVSFRKPHNHENHFHDTTFTRIPQISMANEAFEHPATLNILKSGNYICLTTKNMAQTSQVNHQTLVGRLKHMTYQIGNKKKTVMLNDRKVYVPLEVMQFVYFMEESLLQGFLELTMTCTVGDLHMPESKALFMIQLGI